MDARHSTIATLRAASGSSHNLARGTLAGEARAAVGLGSAPTLGVVPGRRLGRQATLSKGLRLLQPPAALPLFDVSVAVLDSLNLMRASMEEEVVLQSTLAVPVHHAFACKIEAYGTPFGAPQLQHVARGDMTEDDKQFAACLAAPPDSDIIGDTPELSLQRMASLGALQHSPSLAAAARGEEAPATPGSAVRGARAGELVRSPSLQTGQKKQKRGAHGGMRGNSVGADNIFEEGNEGSEGDDAAALLDVSTARGRAAVAVASSEAKAGPWRPWQVFAGTDDAVAAMVGVGYLIMRAVGSGRTLATPERLTSRLRRMSLSPRRSPGPLPLGGSRGVMNAA